MKRNIMKILLISYILFSQLLVASDVEQGYMETSVAAAGNENSPTLFLNKSRNTSLSEYSFELPINTLKVRLAGNKKRVHAIEKLLSNMQQLLEIGQISDLDILLWNEVLSSVKHDILLDEYKIKTKNFKPQTNTEYLSEKVDIHLQELKFLDKQIVRMKALHDAMLSTELTYNILNVKVANAFSSYEVSLSLYNNQSTQKKKSYEDLIIKMNKLFYSE